MITPPRPARPAARALVAATACVALGIGSLAAALPASAASAASSAKPTAAKQSAQPTATHRVTLITGDRVTVTDLSDGTHAVQIDTAIPGAGVKTVSAGDDIVVMPDAAVGYVAAGALDRDLFNVSLLIEDGYDDASVDAIPVIVEKTDAAARSRSAAPSVPGLELPLALPSISGAAGTVDHADAARAWEALTATPATPAARSLSAAPASLAGGIQAIHLDGKVHATLDSSVPYIHAPEAWAEGYDGAGVTVAVLDTGYDDTHPDLKGRIAAAKSFVPDESVDKDVNGHGTHVASTIAGTGAASDGVHRGVADGAKLAVGKVLSDEGSGQDSWIIAGMQWAAEQAPIVSMSLGSTEASDGTDVMAKALDEISQSTGALFVVAAGNSSSPETIGSPGAAAQALTIGSVDDPSGALSWFSSQGPLFHSGALKPDLAGPGNDVTAARSADSPGEGYYVSMSGTSMATPHVAGAAAIVKQRYPDYTAAQLRAALTSTATDVGLTSYQAGAGVVDVKNAIDRTLVASGSGDFGMVAWGGSADAVTRTITYTNRGKTPLTVDLEATLADTTPATDDGGVGPRSARGVSAPEGLLSLSTDALVIPAGQSRDVSLTADPAEIEAGHQFTGALVASVDGAAVARTALAAAVESERYDLTITANDFTGAPTQAYAWVSRGADWYAPFAVDGETTLRLPPGTYSVMSFLDLDRTPDTHAQVLVGDPDVVLDRGRSVALDARKAKKVTVDVGRKGLEAAVTRMDYSADGFAGSALLPVTTDELWAQPLTSPHAEFSSTTRWRLQQPTLTVTAGGTALDVIAQVGSTLLDGTLTADAVAAGTGSEADFAALKGKVKGGAEDRVAVVTRSDDVSPSQRAINAAAAGARMLIVVNDADGELSEWVGSDDATVVAPLPVAAVSGVEGRALLKAMSKKTVRIAAKGVPASSEVFDIARYSKGSIPSNLTYRPGKLARIDTTFHGDKRLVGEYRYDFVPGQEVAGGFLMRTSAGMQRTDWVNTDQLRWYQDVSLVDAGWEVRDVTRSYKPGQRTSAEYFGAIVRPYSGPGFWASNRSGSFVQINVPSWADGGDPQHTGSFDTYVEDGPGHQQIDAWVNGEHAASSPAQGAWLEAPDGRSTFKIVSTTSHDAALLPSSTSTRTVWTFASKGTADDYSTQVLPMIQAYYDVSLAKDGTVGAGRRAGDAVPLQLQLSHLAGATGSAKITAATLEMRIGGGKWTTVRLSSLKQVSGGKPGTAEGTFPTGREFLATANASLAVPDAGAWIDLRVTAKDAAGSTFSQELTHAVRAAPAKKASHGCKRAV